MGLLHDAFQWVIGLSDSRVDQIDLKGLDERHRGIARLQTRWEQDIVQAQREYESLLDPEKHIGQSKIQLRLSLQKAKIAAHRVKQLSNAVGMLSRMADLIESLKILKKAHADLLSAGQIPGGLTLKEFVAQIDKSAAHVQTVTSQLDAIGDSLRTVDEAISRAVPQATPQEDSQLLEAWEALQTLVAEGKGHTEEATALKKKIDELYGLAA